jgi:hypothetical protein
MADRSLKVQITVDRQHTAYHFQLPLLSSVLFMPGDTTHVALSIDKNLGYPLYWAWPLKFDFWKSLLRPESNQGCAKSLHV